MHTIETGSEVPPLQVHRLSSCSCRSIFALGLLDLQRWELFAMSVFYIACGLLSSTAYRAAAPARSGGARIEPCFLSDAAVPTSCVVSQRRISNSHVGPVRSPLSGTTPPSSHAVTGDRHA